MRLFSKPTKEQRFWSWFARNTDRLFQFEADQEAIFDDLGAALEKVHPGLTFEFGPVREGKREFIVSADGIRELSRQSEHSLPRRQFCHGGPSFRFGPRRTSRLS